MTYQELKSEYDNILLKLNEEESENARLRTILRDNNISFEDAKIIKTEMIESSNTQTVGHKMSLQEKVALFRSLFKGREDVFARRWYSKTSGKGGYQPVCAHEWNAQYCDKKNYKCAECPNRQFSPLTYDDVYRHLAGKDEYCRDVIGVYAILDDDNCNFLCSDFDDKSCEHGYKEDVLAFASVCKDWGIPASVEKSRSGKGAHVWIFFEKPLPAVKARKLGNVILTEAMNKNGRISFKSYDRFFPNQDSLTKGGFGNLVALPLQGRARRNGNSVFVDELFMPYSNQWDYLSSVSKISEEVVDILLARHETKSEYGELSKTCESKPWETPISQLVPSVDLPSKLVITKSNMLYIPLKGLSARVISYLRRIASFKNPEFYSRQGMRLSVYNIPRIISCADMSEDYLALPRGCEDAVNDLCVNNSISVENIDETNHGTSISVTFNGVLRAEQEKALDCLTSHNIGILSATTAFGKTVTAAALIAQCKTSTLILVHTRALLNQWKEKLEEFLTIDYTPEETTRKRKSSALSPIGCLCTGQDTLHGIVDVALMQSCLTDNEVKPFVRNYGMVIIDECHHVSAVNFERILKYANARLVYGLTATPIRKDGHQPIIFMQCGPIRYTADAKSQMAGQSFERILIPRFTSFRNITNDVKTYTQVMQDLANDDLRNKLIVQDVIKALNDGRTPIVISSLTSHVMMIAELLRPHCKNVITLIGSESAKEKRMAESRLHSTSDNEPLVIVATGKYIGEGFDFPKLDTLFLTLPVSWKGIIAQYAGRLHRDYPGKREVRIYDYIDVRIPICDIMYKRRLKGYSAIGYKIKSEEISNGIEVDTIFSGKTYRIAFYNDMPTTQHSIIIACPKVQISRNYNIIEDLLRLQNKGVEVIVFVRNKGYDESQLSTSGIEVIIKQQMTLCCTIMDKSICWYGSVNYLGYNSVDNNAIRIKDATVADGLINAIYEYS